MLTEFVGILGGLPQSPYPRGQKHLPDRAHRGLRITLTNAFKFCHFVVLFFKLELPYHLYSSVDKVYPTSVQASFHAVLESTFTENVISLFSVTFGNSLKTFLSISIFVFTFPKLLQIISQEKHQAREQNHLKPAPSNDEKERKLKRIATRGGLC